MIYLIIAAGYVLSGALAYGIEFAYWQRKYPAIARFEYIRDHCAALNSAILGPVGLILTFFIFDYAGYGLKWRATK